jgi:hypothetical protein
MQKPASGGIWEHSQRLKPPNDTSARYNSSNVIEQMNAKRHGRKWSAAVTRGSDALDLENGVFKSDDPHRIALSLKNSAERSNRRKGTPFQSAMSMLNFYINRAGSSLSSRRKNILTRARNELRQVFHRPAH